MDKKIIVLDNDELDNLIKKAVKAAVEELEEITQSSQDKEDEFLSPKEACEFLKFKSLTTLWRRVREGLIPKIEDQGGKLVFYRKSDLVDYQTSLEGR
ncbi:MAG: helix-turn-helix domain-containing protein [Dysgonomonas sp.]|nr:helix-turn-helix domain-containing protein [Dysgonomonas sp.]